MLPPGGFAQTAPAAPRQRSDDEVMSYLLSPDSPLQRGTEVTPQMLAQYRQSGGDEQMDAADQRRQAEGAAYRSAQTGSMGMLQSGPMSSGVADPAAAFKQFEQSGYNGKQALSDGWLTGTGRPGWEGSAGPNSGPSSPVSAMYGAPPPAAPPPSTGGDPYHPPGYTPGVAANTVPPPAPQPGASNGPSSMPSPPSSGPPAAGNPPQPARPHGFGSAPRWNGGGQGMGGQHMGNAFGQQRQSMRNMYGGG